MPKINELATIAAAGAKLVASDSSGDAGNVLASDFATASQGSLADTAVQPNDLATVATSGAYSDLSGTPTLGTAAAADTGDFATAAQGGLAATAVQPNDLAAVATSGAYSDLSGTPTLGTAAAADTGDFATSAQGGLADTAIQPGAIGSTVQGHGDLLDDMAALSDPNADRMLFWDDSAGKVEWLTVGANLSISGTTLNASGGGGGGGGDMDSAIYDPNNVASDVFDMDNMADGTGKVAMAASERSKLSGIEAGADVTDATNVAAAGAVMDGDFSADGMMARTGAGTYASRTITGTSQQITVTNGDGKSGNPTLALASQVTASLGLADSAVQPGDLGTAAYDDTGDFATAGQGSLADTALQPAAIGSTVQAYDADTAKTDAAQTWTGAQQFGQVAGTVTAVPALNIDCSSGNEFTKTIAANSTFTVSNVPASRSYEFRLLLTYTSGTITWFSGVEWLNDEAPSLTGGKVYEVIFTTLDGGTTWYAVAGEYT